MNVWELILLAKCPQKYELEHRILNKHSQKEYAFRQGLEMMAYGLSCYKDWQTISPQIEEFLWENYDESWFELNWQKKAAVRDDIFRMRRLYGWLHANIEGRIISVEELLEMEYQDNYNEYYIHKLQIQADLIVEKADGSILGVLLCKRFVKTYSYYARKNSVFHAIELLCLMICLKCKYIGKKIEVMMVSAISKKDTLGTVSAFEENKGDNVVGFSEVQFREFCKESLLDTMKKSVGEIHSESCRHCVFEEVCKPPVKLYLQKKEACLPEFQTKMNFTEKQQMAIKYKNGPLRVCAGPGAGKTAALVARIQCLIDSGVAPKKILAVTFTNAAAKEIQGRINSEYKPVVSTLHALAFQIVRDQKAIIGSKKLINTVDCMLMLQQVLNQAPMIYGANYKSVCGKHGLIASLCKDFAFIDTHGLEKFRTAFPNKDVNGILRVKEMYDQKFQGAGYIFFDDQIRLGVELLENHSGIRKRIQEAYEYILVDEAQDLDELQARFVSLLIKSPMNNIAIYGDADQSIYGFRGGDNKFMLDFPKNYPGTCDIWLDDNFRSSEEIMSAANMLIAHNQERVPMKMKTQFKTRLRPMLICNFHANRLGIFIHDLLKKGYRQGDIAIIARTNKELECMCDMLEQYNAEHPETAILRYDKPKYYLYQDFTFQCIMDLLSVYLGNYSDDMVWYRLLGALGFRPEKKDIKKTIYTDYLERGKIFSFSGEEETLYLSKTACKTKEQQIFSKIYRASRLFALPIDLVIPRVVDFFCDENIDNLEVIEILDDIIRHRRIKTAEELYLYMCAVKRFRDDTRLSYHTDHREKLHMLTAHDSKGKEFSVVLIYGIDMFEKDDSQEGRRLLYVALTRAKERLYLTELCKGKSMFLQEFTEKIDIIGGMRYA